MKNLPRPGLSRLRLLIALAAATSGPAALTPTEWQHRQALNVPVPGLVKVALPAATFDAALPDLADLRLIDGAAQEVPYLLDREFPSRDPLPVEPVRLLGAKSFRTTPNADTTQLIIETGTTDRLDAIDLETSVPYFLKAAHVEVSANGIDWESLGSALPVFRQFGAEQLRLGLNRRAAAFVRVTLDDFRSRQVAFTGAELLPAPARVGPPVLVPVGARIVRRDEFAGETVLTVALDGRHVPLAALGLEVKDPLFMRRVTVAVREARGAVSGERTVGTGTLYRVALDGAAPRAQLEVPLDFTPLTRELLVHIHNGDSPPLKLDGVAAKQHPVNLLFLASAAGAFTLLSGNPQATAPRYDLAAFAGEMHTASAAPAVPGDLEAMPDYHSRESLGTPPLPDLQLAGAPLDTKDWLYRHSIQITRAGVQELELDLAALAGSRPDYADLRLVRAGNQIPYVLEQPALARSLTITPVATPDKKRPAVSVWQLPLPQAGLPLRRLVLTTTTPLFQRQFRIYERLAGADGGHFENTLASDQWSRTPEPGVPESHVFELLDRTGSDTLWIEADNGDNPAIALGAVQVVYPVVRLVYKVAEPDGFALAYGNKNASAPRYDLGLVAVKLLTSSRNIAQLAPGEAGPAVGRSWNPFTGANSRYVFWGALALVVIALLGVVAKLLPKPPVA